MNFSARCPKWRGYFNASGCPKGGVALKTISFVGRSELFSGTTQLLKFDWLTFVDEFTVHGWINVKSGKFH